MSIPSDHVDEYERVNFKGMAYEVAKGMLLEQYANSTNLKDYIACLLEEFDELYVQMDAVNFGRFLKYAVGAQLDTIGEILQQSRNIKTDGAENFGFVGANYVAGMADNATPLAGGVFLDSQNSKFTVVPLVDDVYRRLLLVRGQCVTTDTLTVNKLYSLIDILVPGTQPIEILELRNGSLEVRISNHRATLTDISLLKAISHWLIPAGSVVTYKLV